MRRTTSTYFCDVCRSQIDEEDTVEDWTVRNWGLCEECAEAYWLDASPLQEFPDQLIVRLRSFADDGGEGVKR
ncbi:MAG: hypothetical protein ACYTG0_42450 [Planctomycetota bacterium]|jgi:hypothetical protein